MIFDLILPVHTEINRFKPTKQIGIWYDIIVKETKAIRKGPVEKS